MQGRLIHTPVVFRLCFSNVNKKGDSSEDGSHHCAFFYDTNTMSVLERKDNRRIPQHTVQCGGYVLLIPEMEYRSTSG